MKVDEILVVKTNPEEGKTFEVLCKVATEYFLESLRGPWGSEKYTMGVWVGDLSVVGEITHKTVRDVLEGRAYILEYDSESETIKPLEI